MHSTNLDSFAADNQSLLKSTSSSATISKDVKCALTINTSNEEFPTSSTYQRTTITATSPKHSPKTNDSVKYKTNYLSLKMDFTSETTPNLNLNTLQPNSLSNSVINQASDYLNAYSYSNHQPYPLARLTVIDSQHNNINNNNLNNNFNNNNTTNQQISQELTNSNEILIKNNHLQSTSNTSLLGTLLATTRQSPTVPESRTEEQSGLVRNNNYAPLNELNSNIFSTRQLSQEYLLKHKNALQCERNEMLQSISSSTINKVFFITIHFTLLAEQKIF